MVKLHIETGVDKLVDLVNKKKKIEISHASKELGVSNTVVQEWADFLEEQGIISIEYSLSKVYLVERKLSQKEIDSKEKEYSAKKDAFVRKVETTLQTLDKESIGFEEVNKKFKELEKEIGSEIEKVKDQVDELKHYEDLKKNLDDEIINQKLQYEKMFDDLHKQIKFEEKKYDKLAEEILNEKSRISEEKLDLEYMEKKEENLKKRIEAVKEILKLLEGQLKEEEVAFDSNMKKLEDLEAEADKLIVEIDKKKKTDMKPLLEESEVNKEKVIKIQDDLLRKIKERREKMQEYESEGAKISKEFENFFKKKAETEKFLEKIEKEKIDLQKEMHDMITSAKAFQLSVKSADVNKHIKELESNFEKLEKKRKNFKKDINVLSDKVMGKKK